MYKSCVKKECSRLHNMYTINDGIKLVIIIIRKQCHNFINDERYNNALLRLL